jgi:hypothetical protein
VQLHAPRQSTDGPCEPLLHVVPHGPFGAQSSVDPPHASVGPLHSIVHVPRPQCWSTSPHESYAVHFIEHAYWAGQLTTVVLWQLKSAGQSIVVSLHAPAAHSILQTLPSQLVHCDGHAPPGATRSATHAPASGALSFLVPPTESPPHAPRSNRSANRFTDEPP